MTSPPIATVGGVWVVEMTVLVAVPQQMLSPAPDAELHSIQNVTVPPPAVTAGNVIATSFVTDPDAAGLMFVELIDWRAYVVYVSSPAVAAVDASVSVDVHSRATGSGRCRSRSRRCDRGSCSRPRHRSTRAEHRLDAASIIDRISGSSRS
jgi:hypothetical protein